MCLCFGVSTLQANAMGGWGYKYQDAGGIYAGTTAPQSASNNISNEQFDLHNLKKGEASARNILHIIETGDASINQAALNGRITKIYYVDTQINKVYIPLGFLPIYAKETKTIVYGE